MDVQKLIDDGERLRALIKSWSAAGPAGALERALVLEKLRGLYETILLSEPVPACGVSESHAAVQGEASVPTAGRPGPDAPSESAQEEPSCDVGFAAAGEGHAEKEIPAATAGDVPEAVAEIPAGACAETAEAPQDGCATAAAEALPDGEDSVEQKLFDDEPVTRHRVDKRVILSLYGDVPAASPYPASASYRKHEEAAGLPTVSEPEGISSHTAVPDGGTSKKVLGEVLAGSGATAMNEVLGKQTLHADVASKIQQGIRGELRQHIGVNDRFMLIRNLFGGDAAAYSATIERLDSFTDLDDALLYMQENFEWDPDSEGVQLLVDLLERKLS